ncbi:hypothetical protein TrVFT333_002321 [Trichoderma virens FT-333]|nr:hypothetical protein TrVFT333_002321 [Trichoderma virens FT-333]
MTFLKPTTKETEASVPIVTQIANEDKVAWYKKPNLRYLYFILFPACMGIELTSGFDSQMINALQIVPSWVSYFENPQGSLKGIIAAAYSLGAILSLPFIPIVNDKFGRRWSIVGGSLIMIIGALIQGFSQHVAMYIVARIILGFGIPTCIVSGSSLIGELGYPKERAHPQQLGLANPSLLQMGPSVIQIVFVFMLPESPRWLITKGRNAEANEILIKYHAEGDADSEFVRAEMAQIQSTIELESANAKKNWLSIFATAGMRRRSIISSFLGLFTQWSGNTLISYYLGDLLGMIGQTDSVFKQKINVAIACWSLIAGVTVSLLVNRFKRRTMYLACTCSLLVVYICWTVTMEQSIAGNLINKPNKAAGAATIFFIFMYQPCYNIGYNALTYTYLVELWPYTERSRGIALFQLFGRLAGFFATFVNPIGLDNISWRWLIVYCCWLAFEIVFVYFMFPETAGRTLEELSFLFEDKALADQATMAVEKVVHHDDGDKAVEIGEVHHEEKTSKV